jgi:uncharacterized membrane protein YcaP (DUF421 family)
MEIVVRATIVYWFLWLVMRGIGKRELSEMSPFELILLVTFGDLVQQGVTQEDFSITGVVIAVGTFAFWVVLVAYGQFRWPRVRRALSGTAAVVVRDGVPLERVLRLQRTTLDDVREAAREQGIGNLRDVRLGILEPDGKFSFLRAEGGQQAREDEPAEA